MKISKKQKGEIFYKYGGYCSYCGEELSPFGSWEIDHLYPHSRGGDNSIDNLVPACRKCNRSKRDNTPEEFKKVLISKMHRKCEELYVLVQNTKAYHFSPNEAEDKYRKRCHQLIELLHKKISKINISFFFELVEKQK